MSMAYSFSPLATKLIVCNASHADPLFCLVAALCICRFEVVRPTSTTDRICSPCHAACDGCDGPTSRNCTICGVSSFLTAESRCCHKTCVDCEGLTNADDECTLCPTHKALHAGQCLAGCPSGWYKNANGACVRCETDCSRCQLLTHTDGTCVNRCPPGYHVVSGKGMCAACPRDCRICSDDGRLCFSCQNDAFLQTNCTNCLRNDVCVSACDDLLTPFGLGGDTGRECRDTTAPLLTLVGQAILTAEAGVRLPPGAVRAVDLVDGDLTDVIRVIGVPDGVVRRLGEVDVIYHVADRAGNMAVPRTRTYVMVDTTAPLITLVGSETVDVTAGSPFRDAGLNVSDNVDNDAALRGNITHSTDVNVDVVGMYTSNWTVTDSSGNVAHASRRVRVIDSSAPIILLAGSDTVTVLFGEPYADAGVLAVVDIPECYNTSRRCHLLDDLQVGLMCC